MTRRARSLLQAGQEFAHGRCHDRSSTCGPQERRSRNIEQLAEQADRILDEVERAIVGKREALELVLLGMLADGHVLLEDVPGLAKTLIARAFAQ